MKVVRRSDNNGKSGHLLISVPASRVTEVEAAQTFLEEKRQQRGAHVVIDLIVRAALRNGWRPTLFGTYFSMTQKVVVQPIGQLKRFIIYRNAPHCCISSS